MRGRRGSALAATATLGAVAALAVSGRDGARPPAPRATPPETSYLAAGATNRAALLVRARARAARRPVVDRSRLRTPFSHASGHPEEGFFRELPFRLPEGAR